MRLWYFLDHTEAIATTEEDLLVKMGEHFVDTIYTTHNKPLLLYGTSRKENRTRFLTETALNIGFTAVDTANYPSAYNEPHTGDGIAAAIKSGVIKRENLFVRGIITPVICFILTHFLLDSNEVLSRIHPSKGQDSI